MVLLVAAGAFFSGGACTSFREAFTYRSPQQQQRQQQRQQNKTVNPKAQKFYYDQGLQLYSKESYKEAKEAFETVVDNGPNTTLGLKAQENITKIDQILKTLEDIESK